MTDSIARTAIMKLAEDSSSELTEDDMCVELARIMLEDHVDVAFNGNPSLISALGLKSTRV